MSMMLTTSSTICICLNLTRASGDPLPDPKRVKFLGPPKTKAPPPNVDRAALIADIQSGVLSAADVEFAVKIQCTLSSSSSSGQKLSGQRV